MTRRHLSAVWAGTVLVGFVFGLPTAARAQAGAQAGTEESVLESKSNVAFPVRLQVPAGEDFHTLVGMGLREKTVFKVDVYAFGLYVDAPRAASALENWNGRSARELEKDESFYEELLKDNFGKTLRLLMTRDVSGDDMADAFEDALGPRVARAAEEMGMPAGDEALTQFRGYFSVEELTKETELVFTWLPGGTLVTSVQGEVKGEIQSAALSWALFDVYLGDHPISKGGKKSVIARFPELLAGAPEVQTPSGS